MGVMLERVDRWLSGVLKDLIDEKRFKELNVGSGDKR